MSALAYSVCSESCLMCEVTGGEMTCRACCEGYCRECSDQHETPRTGADEEESE